MKRTRLIFSGSGGQGVITAAIILAEAAVIHEGMNATQSQSYGAAARGGATRSDVIISNDIIYYPEVNQANILVCLTQESYNTYASLVRPGGFVITDSKYVQIAKKVDAKQIEVPMYESVMAQIGKPIVFNICMLGALLGITEFLKPTSVMKIVETRIPEDFIQMNQEALDLGMELGAQYTRF
ncbi:PorA1' [Desulfamplus magnetovallimortis]|uniref:PorA1 n=1 Tax=Desulfamplus magnetovallimortis TaxID=1246637 RepID=A0A1W1H6D3_9BACT|nr:2-oxoacid:acceptor oxidoreductase family protein [Desulfamplus magnetovallimortis]SLM27994.1 PorA1' [Desulfamplus magnetovallimortis]